MSFGTGHHKTTSLMIEQMLTMDLMGKKVLDMGSGTGILAIVASKLKAKEVLAIDIDDCAFQNACENKDLNKAFNVTIEMGDSQQLKGRIFDVILANISRNVLLTDIPCYSACLFKGGQLLVSGIYKFDMDMVIECARSHQLVYMKDLERNHWVSLLFNKKNFK